jgi:hypothetical protein
MSRSGSVPVSVEVGPLDGERETHLLSPDNTEVLSRTTGQTVPDPVKLIVPMIERFMAADRAFAKARRGIVAQDAGGPERSG